MGCCHGRLCSPSFAPSLPPSRAAAVVVATPRTPSSEGRAAAATAVISVTAPALPHGRIPALVLLDVPQQPQRGVFRGRVPGEVATARRAWGVTSRVASVYSLRGPVGPPLAAE